MNVPEPAFRDLEITVGVRAADVTGVDQQAIQHAILLAQDRGIGRVRILKGAYLCLDSIRLAPGLTLTGEGEETVLRKPPRVESPLVRSVSHYERVIEVRDPDLFPVGSGIRVHGLHRQSGVPVSVRATVVARDGRRLLLDRDYLGESFWLETGEAKATNRVPLIAGDRAHAAVARDMHLEGRARPEDPPQHNDDGLYLWNSHGVRVEGLVSRNHSGDGIGFEISNDVQVLGCMLEGNTMPLHAGSGSCRMRVHGNRIQHNRNGFYYCWGIQHGTLEDNDMRENGTYGISVGFHDSHNVIRGNRVIGNRKVGISFRAAHHPSQSPCDNLVVENRIEDNGPDAEPLGIRIEAAADDIRLVRNVVAERRRPGKGVGVRVDPGVGHVAMEDNEIAGFARDALDARET